MRNRDDRQAMAWNEPGGNGDRDPWGQRGSQQGPPDLDEALRKLRLQLGRIFGGRGGGGGLGGVSLGGGGRIGAGVIAAALGVIWLLSGVFIVDPAEQGVVLRFGSYARTEASGPHWAPRFVESVEKVNVEQIRNAEIGFRSAGGSKGSVINESQMLTGDENIVDLKFAVQYRVKDAKNYLFRVADPDLTLRAATESAVREIVGRSGMDYVLTTGRDGVANEAKLLIQEILDRYETGLQVTSVNMQDAQPPAQVQDAFFDAVKAREDQVRIINEAKAYKADVVPKARGEASAVRQRAEAYRQRVIAQAEGEAERFRKVLDAYRQAPEVTRERMYLESVESVMSNASKVMVDVKGGNNLLYLPIDRLIGDRAAGPSAAAAAETENTRIPRSLGFDARRSRNGNGRAR